MTRKRWLVYFSVCSLPELLCEVSGWTRAPQLQLCWLSAASQARCNLLATAQGMLVA